ncbi:phosphatidylserine decarboxylase [Sistotremastrum niveocremeum HHB9708]|uniref:Phosphatidylserine decarboxylase proenzyme 1, mitochondrial n=1 Tax=Sistotremastrum niveocremeum HHB9708 TaxID=1314777 RepID=A0A164R4T4_9AGAM|nr:phosphatidylserine decarboxylase [Sistotremastrum niveocremeum HHB9708]
MRLRLRRTVSLRFLKGWFEHATDRHYLLSKLLYSTSSNSTSGPERQKAEEPKVKAPLYRRVAEAWKETPTTWYPLPVAVGALLLVALQYRKKRSERAEVDSSPDGSQVVRLKGPWQVHVLGALPLRNMSRVWGYLNSLELPIWIRPTGFRLYSFIFSADLSEIEHSSDLTKYVSLGDFFYRRLKPGSRPIAEALLVSPADGRILHLGEIDSEGDGRVEQVKGLSYSLDALLGVERGEKGEGKDVIEVPFKRGDLEHVDDKEFANVNGIEYSLDQLIGRGGSPAKDGPADASVEQPAGSTIRDASVAMEVGVRPGIGRKSSFSELKEGSGLFFAVIYLAPGDYHRFHSPTAWVVERRRHFAGELFSVSPWMARRLANLFVLNERVALLGRWKHGFFSMIPVGATNVGSIKINFDEALRTNVRGRKPPAGTFTEAVYSAASPILHGQPLRPGQEMGGFSLGSTIVLVFEAPKGFGFSVKAGEVVRVGQALGDIGPAGASESEEVAVVQSSS